MKKPELRSIHDYERGIIFQFLHTNMMHAIKYFSAVPFDSNKFNSPIEPCDSYSYIGKSFQPGDSRALVDRLYLNPKVYQPIFQNVDTALFEDERKTVKDIEAYLTGQRVFSEKEIQVLGI